MTHAPPSPMPTKRTYAHTACQPTCIAQPHPVPQSIQNTSKCFHSTSRRPYLYAHAVRYPSSLPFLLYFLAPLRMSSTSIAIFSCISLLPSECPAPPSPSSLLFPCPPQNVQHLHRHFLLHFLAPLRMSSTCTCCALPFFIAIASCISLPPSECPAPPLPEQVTTSTPETQLPHTPTWQPAHTTRCVFTFMCACVCVSVPVCFFECTYFRYCEQRQCARTSHRLKNVQHTLLVHP